MVYTIDKHAYVHLIFFCFSVMCSNEYNFLKYSCAATTDVFSGGTGMLLWGVISDSVSAGFGYFLMYILKRPLRGDPQLARQETNADKQLSRKATYYSFHCTVPIPVKHLLWSSDPCYAFIFWTSFFTAHMYLF